MKKNIILCLIALLFTLTSYAQSGIKFEEDSWAMIVSKAKAEKKLIFLDAYTTWCGPCKLLQVNVFPNEELGKYFGNHFLSTKIDMEKGEGPNISRKYDVRAYPTLLFIDPNTQQIVHKVLGYKNVEQLKAVAEVAVSKKSNESR